MIAVFAVIVATRSQKSRHIIVNLAWMRGVLGVKSEAKGESDNYIHYN